jgi:5-methylcytosine-specific restriction endonuclease McrA
VNLVIRGFKSRHPPKSKETIVLTGEAKRAYQLEWISRRRQDWIDANGPCAVCDSREELEVDHRDRSTKLYDVSVIWSMSLDNPIRIAELAKCQVLCKVCHLEKTKLELLVHGTSQYKKGCRCDVCRVAKSVEKALYLTRKRQRA